MQAAELRAKAAEYRANAMKERDARTRAQYLAVAEYFDDWAIQAAAEEAACRTAPPERQAGRGG